MREQVMEWIERYKVIAILRGIEPKQCRDVIKALYDGGIRLAEITYDPQRPETWQDTADTIGCIEKEFAGKLLTGAGTVLTTKQVDLTAAAGGQFVISPDVNEEVIGQTRKRGMVSIPGAATASEAMAAYRAGADIVKLFPAKELGAGYLKALRAPLGQIRFMAVGGIGEENIAEYLAAGAIGAGVGGRLTSRELAQEGRLDEMRERAERLMKAAAV